MRQPPPPQSGGGAELPGEEDTQGAKLDMSRRGPTAPHSGQGRVFSASSRWLIESRAENFSPQASHWYS